MINILFSFFLGKYKYISIVIKVIMMILNIMYFFILV